MKKVYVVKVGNNLYMDSSMYSFYQSTTRDITKAHKFASEEQANKAAAKALKGEVECLLMMSEDEYNDEINVLKDAYKQLQSENIKLKNEIDHLKQQNNSEGGTI